MVQTVELADAFKDADVEPGIDGFMGMAFVGARQSKYLLVCLSRIV